MNSLFAYSGSSMELLEDSEQRDSVITPAFLKKEKNINVDI